MAKYRCALGLWRKHQTCAVRFGHRFRGNRPPRASCQRQKCGPTRFPAGEPLHPASSRRPIRFPVSLGAQELKPEDPTKLIPSAQPESFRNRLGVTSWIFLPRSTFSDTILCVPIESRSPERDFGRNWLAGKRTRCPTRSAAVQLLPERV